MTIRDWLDFALSFARKRSGCNKVAVGSVIIKDNRAIAVGANRAIPDYCKTSRGCLRMEKYGNDSKVHRDPSDCRAIHSEVDAICSAACNGASINGATICVTRYPCESCAKAIVASGIAQVYYGGTADISEQTRLIFDIAGINVYKVEDWLEDNTDR